MSLKEQQREHTKALILQASLAVFAEKGYHGTSVEDLSQAVDCSPATLYKHFEGKAAIFSALVAKHTDEHLDEMSDLLARAPSFDSALNALLQFVAHSGRNDRDYLQLLLSVLHAPEAGILPNPDLAKEQNTRHMALIAGLMERGVAEGVLADRPVTLLALNLMGALYINLYGWLLAGVDEGLEDMLVVSKEIFLKGACPTEKA